MRVNSNDLLVIRGFLRRGSVLQCVQLALIEIEVVVS